MLHVEVFIIVDRNKHVLHVMTDNTLDVNSNMKVTPSTSISFLKVHPYYYEEDFEEWGWGRGVYAV